VTSLAHLHRSKGEFEEARELYGQALELLQKAPTDIDGEASVVKGLGALARDTGDLKGAEAHYIRLLELVEQLPGADAHPSARAYLEEAGKHWESLGQYVPAQPLFQRALAACESTQAQNGVPTMELSACLNSLANVLQYQSQFDEAEPLYQRALAVDAAQPNAAADSRTATTLNNYASMLQGQGRYDAAEAHYRHAIHIVEASVGAKHIQ
jgi:tetratricopeptide (TPR) repeat protein